MTNLIIINRIIFLFLLIKELLLANKIDDNRFKLENDTFSINIRSKLLSSDNERNLFEIKPREVEHLIFNNILSLKNVSSFKTDILYRSNKYAYVQLFQKSPLRFALDHNSTIDTYFYLVQKVSIHSIQLFYGCVDNYFDVTSFIPIFIDEGYLHIPLGTNNYRYVLFSNYMPNMSPHCKFLDVIINNNLISTLSDDEEMYIDIDIFDDDNILSNITTREEIGWLCEKLNYRIGAELGNHISFLKDFILFDI